MGVRETDARLRASADERAARPGANGADKSAARAGMGFSDPLAARVCDWIETNCYLYEGDRAGSPLSLYDSQRDFVTRLFGWVKWSEEYGAWIRRFRAASLWMPKKNGKSPLLAAIGLYLLCDDGEPGQKVYAAAKNGDQAKIGQRHAYAMVEQSPALSAVCKLNATTLSISHLPTRSMMLILTGDDSRGAKAKEGINGSVLIDECHVFDREMHERTSRAGISRREPLNLAVSTAGDDPSSYGYERWEYGRQVNAGDRADPHFLHAEYSADSAAPGKPITDAEIDARLDEFGARANPAWGVIVKPSEFRADWMTCKGKPREAARFRQYRLNLWVGSTNQWLDTGGWDKGRRAFALDDLRGRPCVVGLDLSRTRDMTACVMLFPWDEDGPECVRLWPLFWLPAKRAADLDHLFPYRSWAATGELKLTAGDVVDYAQVESDIVGTVRDYDLRVGGLYFDQWNAEEITQRLADALYCERHAVRQGYLTLSPLAKEFERRLIAGLMQHAGNGVMGWQVGHVEVKSDSNRNLMPVKPDSNTGKSIDGIMAALDAMAGIVSGAAGSGGTPSVLFL